MAIINNTLSDQLTYLEETKEQIKQALIDKGQLINNEVPFRSYVDNINNLGTAQLYNNIDEMNTSTSAVNGSIGIVYDIDNSNFQGLYYYNVNQYEPAKTQFKASDEDVMEVAYFGKNGPSVGNLNSVKYINDDNKTDISNFYNKIFNLLDTIDTSNIANYSEMHIYTPYFKIGNLSNVTNFANAFTRLSNVKLIDNLNNHYMETSNIINMQNAFNQMTSLLEINISNSYFNNVTSLKNAFTSCWNLKEISMDNTNFCNVTDLSSLCYNCSNLSLVRCNNANFYNVTNWFRAFAFCHNLRAVAGMQHNYNIFKNAENLGECFENCHNLSSNLVINAANNITNLKDFASGTKLTSLVIRNCNLQNCTDMTNLAQFKGNNLELRDLNLDAALLYNALKNTGVQNITLTSSNLTNVQNITNWAYIFNSCSSLQNLQLINKADNKLTYIQNFQNFCGDCANLRHANLCLIDIGNVTDLSSMFNKCSNVHTINLCLNINSLNNNPGMNIAQAFNGCSNLSAIHLAGYNYNKPIPITNAFATFQNCTKMNKFYSVTASGSGYIYMTSFNFSPCENTAYMYSNCGNRNVYPAPYIFLGNINTNLYNCKNTAYMFYNTNWSIPIQKFLNLDNCENTAYMFGRTDGYLNNGIQNINLGSLHNCKNTAYMFSNMARKYNMVSSIEWVNDTPVVQNCTGMFSDIAAVINKLNFHNLNLAYLNQCSNIILNTQINYIDFSEANFSNISAALMFKSCTITKEINLSNLRLNTINSYHMFCNCENLINLNLDNLNFENIINSYQMFYRCLNLTTDLNLNLCNYPNCAAMFMYCQNLNYINFDYLTANNCCDMFYNCTNLNYININTLDLSKCNNLYRMFYNCINLKSDININAINTNSLYQCFTNCGNIKNIRLELGMTNIINIGENLFRNCTNLINLEITPEAQLKGTGCYTFTNCYNLTNIPNINLMLSNGYFAFENCYNLTEVPYINLNNCNNVYYMFSNCYNLSDSSIHNIINSFLNCDTITRYKNLSSDASGSPFHLTNIDNSRYENRWAELDAAGWTY